MNIYRHGDLLIKQIEKLPEGKVESGTSFVLALGEATGHHHTLTGSINAIMGYDANKHARYLEVLDAPATLTHQEHSMLSIVPGCYEIIREREYDYFEESMKQVLD